MATEFSTEQRVKLDRIRSRVLGDLRDTKYRTRYRDLRRALANVDEDGLRGNADLDGIVQSIDRLVSDIENL